MSTKYVEPSISSVSFSCPHCGAHAQQTWFRVEVDQIKNNGTPFRPDAETIQALVDEERRIENDAREGHREFIKYAARVGSNELFLSWQLSEYGKNAQLANVHVSYCYACKGFAIWAVDRMIYPFLATTAIAPNEDLDAEIQRDFKEAVLILDASPRGAAGLLRQCIQKLCAQLGEPGKNINEDIASLVQKGLDKRIQRALDIVRVIGNDAVHPGQIDIRDDRDTALELARLVNVIADVMVTQPKKIDAMYEKLPESKRKAIEARDKKGAPPDEKPT